jgi:hypothetical protein
MLINDRRTDAQKKTHHYFVVGTDRFLSGWGEAEGGASYAAWACRTYDEALRMAHRVRARGDQHRVRVVDARCYRPSCKHLSIYVACDELVV